MYLPDVSLVIVGRFQNEGAAGEGGMQRDPSHGLHADLSLPKLLMAVLMRTAGVFAVIEMNRQQTLQADHFVEPGQHTVRILHQIIARIPHVAGVQTDAQLVLLLNPVDDLPQFFKAAAYL